MGKGTWTVRAAQGLAACEIGRRATLLVGVMAIVLGATSWSWALDVKWGGDFRLRYFYIDNLTDQNDDTQDAASYWSSRFLLTAHVEEDDVSGVVTLIAGRSLQNGHANRLLGSTSYGPDAGSDVGILEAYIRADFDTWTLKGGRAVYKLGNGIILDDSVDGVWVNLGADVASVTLAALKILERTDDSVVGIGNVTATPNVGPGGDADLYVANVGFGRNVGPLHHVNIFGGYWVDRAGALIPIAADDGELWIIGAAADADVAAVKLKAEFDYLTGEQTLGATSTDLEGWNAVLGAKLNAAVPIAVDLIYTTGQEPGAGEINVNGLNGNYPVGIIITNTGARSLDTKDGTCLSINGASLGGSLGCYGGAGLTAIKVSTGLDVGQMVLDLAAIWAQSTEDNAAGESDVGIELDGTLSYGLTDRLNVLGGIGYLLSGDFYRTVGNTDPDDQVVVVSQLSYTF